MLVIVVAVITQGFRVPSESRGEVKSLLFINSGFFQAVGVISFGKSALPKNLKLYEIMSNRP
jgi:sodium-coupled neutral amino acid transporter 11